MNFKSIEDQFRSRRNVILLVNENQRVLSALHISNFSKFKLPITGCLFLSVTIKLSGYLKGANELTLGYSFAEL